MPALAQHIAKGRGRSPRTCCAWPAAPTTAPRAPWTDLQQAITLIGEGRPAERDRPAWCSSRSSNPRPGPLSALAGARLWEHAESLAGFTAEGARAAGLPGFDGYLAGLLHDAGWTIALRVIDRAPLEIALPPSVDFSVKLTRRAHRLFGLAAQRWNITPRLRGAGGRRAGASAGAEHAAAGDGAAGAPSPDALIDLQATP